MEASEVVERLGVLEAQLASERAARIADAEAHARALTAAGQQKTDALAERDLERAAALVARDQAHAGEIANRDRALAVVDAASAERFTNLEDALADEREARAAGQATYGRSLAAAKQEKVEALEQRDVERFEALEEVARTHNEARAADADAHARILAEEQAQHAEERAAAAALVTDLERALDEAAQARAADAAHAEERATGLLAEREAAVRSGDEVRAALEQRTAALALTEKAIAEENAKQKGEAALHADELADRERTHSEEIALTDRAHADSLAKRDRLLAASERSAGEALAAANARLAAAERVRSGDREALADSVAAHARDLAASKKQKEEAVAERDRQHAEALGEHNLIHAEELAAGRFALKAAEDALGADQAERASDAAAHARAVAAEQRRVKELEAEAAQMLAASKKLEVLLEAAERDAIKEELARDAAIGDLQMQVVREREKREELQRAHETALEAARDEALLQALAELKSRKK